MIRKIAQILGYALAFATTFALARFLIIYMGEDEYAAYLLAVSITLFVRIPWYNIATTTLARFLREETLRSPSAIYSAILVYSFFPGFLLAISILLIFATNTVLEIGQIQLTSTEVSGSLALGFALGLNSISVELDNVQLNRYAAIIGLAFPNVAQLFIVVAIAQANLGIEWFLWGSAACISLLSSARILLVVAGISKPPPGSSDLKSPKALMGEMLRYSGPMFLWIIPSLIGRAADRWVVADQLSAIALAQFGIVLLLSQGVMTAVYSILSRLFVPTMFKLHAEGNYDMAHAVAWKMVLAILGAGALGAAAYLFVGQQILDFMAAPPGLPSYALIAAAGAATLNASADAALMHSHLKKRLGRHNVSKFISPLVYIALALAMIGPLGIGGVALALLASSIFYFGTTLYTVRR